MDNLKPHMLQGEGYKTFGAEGMGLRLPEMPSDRNAPLGHVWHNA